MQMYSNARAKSCHVEFIFFLRKRKEKKIKVHKTNKTIYYILHYTAAAILCKRRISRLVNKLNTLVFLYTFFVV